MKRPRSKSPDRRATVPRTAAGAAASAVTCVRTLRPLGRGKRGAVDECVLTTADGREHVAALKVFASADDLEKERAMLRAMHSRLPRWARRMVVEPLDLSATEGLALPVLGESLWSRGCSAEAPLPAEEWARLLVQLLALSAELRRRDLQHGDFITVNMLLPRASPPSQSAAPAPEGGDRPHDDVDVYGCAVPARLLAEPAVVVVDAEQACAVDGRRARPLDVDNARNCRDAVLLLHHLYSWRLRAVSERLAPDAELTDALMGAFVRERHPGGREHVDQLLRSPRPPRVWELFDECVAREAAATPWPFPDSVLRVLRPAFDAFAADPATRGMKPKYRVPDALGAFMRRWLGQCVRELLRLLPRPGSPGAPPSASGGGDRAGQ